MGRSIYEFFFLMGVSGLLWGAAASNGSQAPSSSSQQQAAPPTIIVRDQDTSPYTTHLWGDSPYGAPDPIHNVHQEVIRYRQRAEEYRALEQRYQAMGDQAEAEHYGALATAYEQRAKSAILSLRELERGDTDHWEREERLRELEREWSDRREVETQREVLRVRGIQRDTLVDRIDDQSWHHRYAPYDRTMSPRDERELSRGDYQVRDGRSRNTYPYTYRD